MAATAQFQVLERLIDSGRDPLSPDTARAILKWGFAESDRARIADLSAKARAGTLQDGERDELDWYLMLADLLALLQSKARVALANRPSAA